jgi:hypothetical protein
MRAARPCKRQRLELFLQRVDDRATYIILEKAKQLNDLVQHAHLVHRAVERIRLWDKAYTTNGWDIAEFRDGRVTRVTGEFDGREPFAETLDECLYKFPSTASCWDRPISEGEDCDFGDWEDEVEREKSQQPERVPDTAGFGKEAAEALMRDLAK